MVDILGVHGIGQNNTSTRKLSDSWTAALAQGWPPGSGPAPGVVVPYVGPLLRPATGRLGGDDRLTGAGLSDDELELVMAVAREYLGDPAEDELAALAEAGRTLGMPAFPGPLQQVVQALDAHLGLAVRDRILDLVHEVASYLNRADVRAGVRDALLTAEPHPDLVIGHSLGSVIGYDLAVHGAPFPVLLTMGSPLGLRTIREHPTLTTDAGPAPAAWTNVHDPHDPITAGLALHPFWPQVTDVAVDNGKQDAHGASSYLPHPQTGTAVAGLLRR